MKWQIAKSANPTTPEVAHLTDEAAARLETQIREIFKKESDSNLNELIETLTAVTCHFCTFELRETANASSEIKGELRQLSAHIDTLSAFLRRMSPEARNELDFEISPGFELPANFLAAELPPACRTKDKFADTDKKPEPAPTSSYYIDPTIVMLDRLREAAREVISTREKDGARFRISWHNLAWRVARAMQTHTKVKPSPTPDRHFDLVLRACLESGLATIGAKRKVPGDLRSYTRSVIKSLKASTKP